jgi:hypothetical protein
LTNFEIKIYCGINSLIRALEVRTGRSVRLVSKVSVREESAQCLVGGLYWIWVLS